MGVDNVPCISRTITNETKKNDVEIKQLSLILSLYWPETWQFPLLKHLIYPIILPRQKWLTLINDPLFLMLSFRPAFGNVQVLPNFCLTSLIMHNLRPKTLLMKFRYFILAPTNQYLYNEMHAWIVRADQAIIKTLKEFGLDSNSLQMRLIKNHYIAFEADLWRTHFRWVSEK